MKDYDLVIIGSGSGMNLLDPFLDQNPQARVAVIDKDEPGGICLTRGCIPTKWLVYAADVVRTIESAQHLGITAPIQEINFGKVMARMREHVDGEIGQIRSSLKASNVLDYYAEPARFVAPGELRVGTTVVRGKTILLCTGSKPLIPDVQGLADVPYHTSDTILHLTQRPSSLVIIGGGYIAAEFGHFFSAMGTRVTILGRNAQFLPEEEPEVSALALRQMRQHMRIEVGYEVQRVAASPGGAVVSAFGPSGPLDLEAESILVAAGRASNSDVLDPAAGGIDVDQHGWIRTDAFLRTSQPRVWAFGDANGKHQFKHKANYESTLAWRNIFGGEHVPVDYRTVPRAVFTHPQVAAVGMGEAQAIAELGEDGVRIGLQRYEDTAKGNAMGVKDCFVKLIVRRKDLRILGAHIIGPEASTLIQEVVTLMHAAGGTVETVYEAMHIHPALPEVVERACGNLTSIREYHDRLTEFGLDATT